MAHQETSDVGRLIKDRYLLSARLGSGAHGEVWLADDQEMGRKVALKRVRDNYPASPEARRLALADEAKTLGRLNHPNVVVAHDVVVDNNELWLVMEYLPAGSLADLDRIPTERAARFAVQLIDALAALQRNRILHCDIKPSNVLLADDHTAKLADFGLAQLPDGTVSLPHGGQLVGTPGYMAPEVADGQTPTAASDMFSVGATIYHLVEGHSPYGEPKHYQTMLELAKRGKIVEPRHAGNLSGLLISMLAAKPEDRPSPDDARRQLARLGFGVPKTALRLPMLPLPRPSRGVLVGAGAVVVVGVIAAVLVAFLQSGPSAAAGKPAMPSDPRNVDPCGFVDVATLSGLGKIDKSDDSGNFNRCDMYITTSLGGVDVETQLQTDAEAEGVPQGSTTKTGGMTVVAQPLNGGECDRAIVLDDGDQVDITTTPQHDTQSTTNLCPIADTATNSAVHTITDKGFPKRESLPPSWSWFYVSACGLVDANTLDQFPGVDALHPEVGFDNWECRWNSTTSSASLLVRFDRNGPLSAGDGQPIRVGRYAAFVAQNDYADNSCEVKVQSNHQYTDDQGSQTVELLLVVITGPQPMAQMCTQATGIASAAAAKLPS